MMIIVTENMKELSVHLSDDDVVSFFEDDVMISEYRACDILKTTGGLALVASVREYDVDADSMTEVRAWVYCNTKG